MFQVSLRAARHAAGAHWRLIINQISVRQHAPAWLFVPVRQEGVRRWHLNTMATKQHAVYCMGSLSICAMSGGDTPKTTVWTQPASSSNCTC